jgi:hypothetical protein
MVSTHKGKELTTHLAMIAINVEVFIHRNNTNGFLRSLHWSNCLPTCSTLGSIHSARQNIIKNGDQMKAENTVELFRKEHNQ